MEIPKLIMIIHVLPDWQFRMSNTSRIKFDDFVKKLRMKLAESSTASRYV
jgi:hypothetical protein